MHRLRRTALLPFLLAILTSLSGCASCDPEGATHFISAHPTTDAGDAPVDITNTTQPLLVAMRDAIRATEIGDDEHLVYEGDEEGQKARLKALADLSRELHGTESWSAVIVDRQAYDLALAHTDAEC